MKQKFLCLLLALTLVLGLAATVSAYPDIHDYIIEDDINDTLWDAQPIELGETYSGHAVAYCGDSDLFTFTLKEAAEIRISMVGTGPEMDLALFDSKGKLIANGEHLGFWGEDPAGYQTFNIFPMELAAGTYYVGIWTTDGTNHGYWVEVKEGVFPCEGYHQFNIRKPITPATCQSEGLMLCTCLCGATTTETVPADPEAHTFETEIVTPFTCTEDGLAVHTCTSCGYVEEEILWADHTAPDKLIIQDPTMDDYGYYNYICNDCGYVEEEAGPLYPLDHTFIDVKPGEFYELPVCWALYKGITSGIDAYHFGPNDVCLRSQVVSFLWRAAGRPVVEAENPFVDVKPTDYYYNAVLWAVEEGIVYGIDPTHFAPNDTCNRSQVVTFLWRAAGTPIVQAENPFTDVKPTDYYYNAILWAAKNSVTSGITPSTFEPYQTCNRSQVVTFLYRADNVPESEMHSFELLTNDPSEETGFAYCEGTEFAAGESVIFYAEPWYGYLVQFEVNADTIELYYLGGNYYEFIMPDQDVVMTAHFVPAPGDAHHINMEYANCFALADCLTDADDRDIAKAGEFVQILIFPDEGFTFSEECITVIANGQPMEDWWYLGGLEDDPEYGTVYIVELLMPDTDVDISITCTPGTSPAAAEVRIPVSVN